MKTRRHEFPNAHWAFAFALYEFAQGRRVSVGRDPFHRWHVELYF
jgi:hypothetical protein